MIIFLNLFDLLVDDFNTRNKVLTSKFLRQRYSYHKIRKAFSNFYRRHFHMVSKYNVGLKTLLLQGLSEPEFYGDLAVPSLTYYNGTIINLTYLLVILLSICLMCASIVATCIAAHFAVCRAL